jgi:hypothetical protein
MRRRSKSMFDRTERLPGVAVPTVIFIIGDPEAVRLFPTKMTSEREAVIGEEHFTAADDESLGQFHARICDIARERNTYIVSLGSEPSPAPPLRPPGRPDGVTLN